MKKTFVVFFLVALLAISSSSAQVITIDTDTASDAEIYTIVQALEQVLEQRGYSKPGVTLANFNKIHEGMSYQEVVALFGEEGKEQMTMDMGSLGKMSSYAWGAGLGQAIITFKDGAVSSMTQMGLQ